MTNQFQYLDQQSALVNDTTSNFTQSGTISYDIKAFNWSNGCIVNGLTGYYWLITNNTYNFSANPTFYSIAPQGISRFSIFDTGNDILPSVSYDSDINMWNFTKNNISTINYYFGNWGGVTIPVTKGGTGCTATATGTCGATVLSTSPSITTPTIVTSLTVNGPINLNGSLNFSNWWNTTFMHYNLSTTTPYYNGSACAGNVTLVGGYAHINTTCAIMPYQVFITPITRITSNGSVFVGKNSSTVTPQFNITESTLSDTGTYDWIIFRGQY
jgi:hypothetical protein